MHAHLQKISVSFEYPVCFTEGAFDPENRALVDSIARREPQRRHRLLSVVDGALSDSWPGLVGQIERYVERHQVRLQLAGSPLVIRGGEQVKNDPSATHLLQGHIETLGLDRQSCVVAIGGGALLDMAGYAAATAHRGLRLIRIPTTVLAQADSGVGVKNAINAFGKKNFLGTFAPPFAVINDSRFLQTLQRRDKVAGMAEAIKVALIRDAALFGWILEHVDQLSACAPRAMNFLVRRSAELHLRHIATSGDPFEFGSARPLDFGHWSAHKLESMSSHRLRHGEAVAIGIALDSIYSVHRGLLHVRDLEPILGTLSRLGLPLWDEVLERRGAHGELLVLAGLAEFREHLGGDLTLTLLRRIGQGVEANEVSPHLVARALEDLRGYGVRRCA
ncbi:MAG TPA: 3-dehydroquinate synthase [Myxococcaceae bacterium]|nr:3-dehydroquinate synthase [Myxococcaceae bacterium]